MQSIPLFLFQILDTDLFAFSGEPSGANLPMLVEGQSWTFIEEIRGIRVEEYTDPPEFHEALAAVMRDGHFMFHAQMVPHEQAEADACGQLGTD